MNVALVLTLLAATTVAAPDTLVICPVEFRGALAPWEEYRRGQGHEILVITPPGDAGQLLAAVRRAAAGGRLKFVVLVGDVAAVPTTYAAANVNVRWGSEPTIATDQPLADLDGDGRPDVAVGRIPADTAAELAGVVQKVIRYERSACSGTRPRRVEVVGGVGGFGPVMDRLVEVAARRVFAELVPATYDVQAILASPTSPHCPPPGAFTARVCQQLGDGPFAWIYLGHGLPTELDAVDTPTGRRPILSVADVPNLRPGAGRSLAVLVACYTGAIDASADCLAEELLTSADGPVAVIAATRVTMPYGNAVFGSELLRACFVDRATTLGELWALAGRRTLADSPQDPLRTSFDAIARGLSPPLAHGESPGRPVDLAAERREHVLLYQLLGDPLLRVQYAAAGRETAGGDAVRPAPAARAARTDQSGTVR